MSTPTAARWTTFERPERARRLARTTVVVLLGGTSSEREVSLVSGAAILAALESGSARDAPGSARDAPLVAAAVGVEIDESGRWLVGGEALDAARALEALPRDAVFFLALHGGTGENGTLQGFLELAGRCHTGSGVLASALCMDKHLARLAFASAGLRVADAVLVRRHEGVGEVAPPGPGPWYVKPNRGGSSVLTFRATSVADLRGAVTQVLAAGGDALVEQAVAGVEVTCGVVGNRVGRETALPPVEIRPKQGRFFDYEEKYSASGALELCPPESLDAAAVEVVREHALRAYRVAGCAGYARVDFVWPEAGGEPVILEINTLPGFTPTSLLPREAAATGVGFRELCLELCALAIERFEEERP